MYGYEFHLNGGGCPWRLPSVDHEWALNGMRALACRKTSSQRTRLSLLACLTAKRRTMNSRRDIPWKHRNRIRSDIDRLVVVEQFHNAFRRITINWDSALDRKTMNANLERLLPLTASAVRIEREGGKPDLRLMLGLCKKRMASNESRQQSSDSSHA